MHSHECGRNTASICATLGNGTVLLITQCISSEVMQVELIYGRLGQVDRPYLNVVMPPICCSLTRQPLNSETSWQIVKNQNYENDGDVFVQS